MLWINQSEIDIVLLGNQIGKYTLLRNIKVMKNVKSHKISLIR